MISADEPTFTTVVARTAASLAGSPTPSLLKPTAQHRLEAGVTYRPPVRNTKRGGDG